MKPAEPQGQRVFAFLAPIYQGPAVSTRGAGARMHESGLYPNARNW